MMRIAKVTPQLLQRNLACRIGIGFGGAHCVASAPQAKTLTNHR
jgi:hypothetical protein